MHTVQVGKQRYAFGLQWEELESGRSAAVVFREHAGKEAAGLHAVLSHADGRKVVGFVTPPPKGTFYSAAQALAQRGGDGIYVMPINNEEGRALWYVVIRDGLVVPSTDVVGMPDMIVAAVDEMRNVVTCPLYCAETTSAWADAEPFDIDNLLSGLKLKPLRPIGNTEQGKRLAVVLLALAAVGGGWYMLHSPRVDESALLAEQAWQERHLYLNSLRDTVQLPTSAGWIVDAWNRSRDIFPPVVSGWHLQTLHCTSAQCLATYHAPQGQVHATVPLNTWFASWQDISVQMLPNDQNTLTVRLPLTVPMHDWTDDQLLAPKAWPRPARDVAGRIGLYFSGVRLDGEVTTTPVDSQPPNDAIPLNQETIVLQQAFSLDTERLRMLVDWFGQDGFVIQQLLVTPSGNNQTGLARIEFVRYAGSPHTGSIPE